MPSSACCFTTMCVMQRVDPGVATRKTVLTYFWNGMAYFTKKGKHITSEVAEALLNDGKVRLTKCYSEKKNKYYDCTVMMEDDGERTGFILCFPITLREIVGLSLTGKATRLSSVNEIRHKCNGIQPLFDKCRCPHLRIVYARRLL